MAILKELKKQGDVFPFQTLINKELFLTMKDLKQKLGYSWRQLVEASFTNILNENANKTNRNTLRQVARRKTKNR